MTTATRTRCKHCQSSYIYHPSFYGGDEVNYPYNHQDYCEDCYKVVQEALSKIPVKYEKRFVLSDEYTREQIITHQQERLKTGVPIRRIFPPLYNELGEPQQIVCECMPDGNWYKVEWWINDPETVDISMETWCKI